jgi:hypothetical protein
MHNKKMILLVPALLLAAGTAIAQDDDAPERYTYATYLKCDTSNESLADDYVRKIEAPVMDKLVEDGKLLSWGWMKHHTGGEWRRIRYFQTDSVNSALAGLGTMSKAFEKAGTGDDVGIGVSCKSHDDYIWQVKAGMSGTDRGKAGISVYFTCKMSDEDRADEIVANDFAPIYNKLVKDGKITSWGWQSHVIGGWFRRLLTMTATDYEALMDARGEALAAQYGEDNAAGAEFASICGNHHDYLWDIVHEKQASN